MGHSPMEITMYIFKRFYLFIFREKGKEGEEWERNIYMQENIDWLPLTCPQPGTGPQPRHVP